MALRRKSNFLLTLFMMMVNTGIPELSDSNKLNYLKDTLVPQESDEAAHAHFRRVFDDALKNSWKASVNNFFHNMTRDNA